MLFHMIKHQNFDFLIMFFIVCNVLTMCCDQFDDSPVTVDILKKLSYLYTGVFILEACIKILALGLLKYIQNGWNQ